MQAFHRNNVFHRRCGGRTSIPYIKPYDVNFAASGTQVYVTNLPETLTKNKFFDLFEKLDDLVGHRLIMRDGKCHGFGFALFKTKKAAQKAIELLHGKQRLSNGKFLHASIVEKNIIFVKNLHEEVTWKNLYPIFTQYGKVKYVHVIINERGFNREYSTGKAIVCFHTPEAASNAIAKNNGHVLYGKPMCVEYCKSRYELRKEAFDKYFGRKKNGQLTGRHKRVRNESIDPNDMASMKQTYADRLAIFAKHSHPTKYEEIAELLLEYDNDQLKALFEAPFLLQTHVDKAATLITIRSMQAE